MNRGLIVSCQACENEPLYGYGIMNLMAKAAVAGGACGIRALYYDVESIKNTVNVPVIGLVKQVYADSEIYITPTKKEADLVMATSADCLAMDATLRPRPNGETLEELVSYVRSVCPDMEIMADIATEEEAKNAEKLGFDYISTTLRGYTKESKNARLPDIGFMKKVVKTIKNSKVIAEGGIFERGEIRKISKINPYAVVIGSSITRPAVITSRFVKNLNLR